MVNKDEYIYIKQQVMKEMTKE